MIRNGDRASGMRRREILPKQADNKPVSASVEAARRLVVVKQHLAGKRHAENASEFIQSVIRDLVFVQWDPIAVVAPSHIIALWNRVGNYSPSELDRLLWRERRLLLHWVNRAASIVCTEDYPIYYTLMRHYPESLSASWGSQKEAARRFLAGHRALADSILRQLRDGPLRLSGFREYARSRRSSDGWNSGSVVSSMLFHLEMSGKVMVVGHAGNQNMWGLPEQFLPYWVERIELPEEVLERREAERAIQALGTASAREISYYFPRGRYQNLQSALESLLSDSVIQHVRIEGFREKGARYIHSSDLKLLESLQDGEAWLPRVSLLPPFDNLICGRDRTNRIFGFDYSHEMFLPKEKRKFGYYVLPILHGERIIGRIDPSMDRAKNRLIINSVHAEHGAPADAETASEIAEAVAQFAGFLGAEEVVYARQVPAGWRSAFR